ncbi:thioredoxin family protein [Bacteroidota bacterium]
MAHQFFLDKRPHNGLKYEEYVEKSKNKLESTDHSQLDENEKSLLEYAKLNLHRSARIDKTYEVNEELSTAVKAISQPQLWMVLTEDWCGDSAQNLPYIAKIAASNPLVDLRILLRDDNLDIMDLYLTNGKSRSIPKLVAFNQDGEELFQWGPRPKEAQKFVDKAKADGLSKSEFIEKLHLWYARNKGENIEDEFKEIILR